ncbi:CCAAT/enhancer-binding protein alpha-like isoform X1 [Pyrgilauda ruficollis]|uniref:CCAAT/enhancer-binding protein alpha-like isoform X1 n=1 Tax=Pyrgilauda ruficollis TaxID=221976 RepID=UPI001B884193|nr:CCAAT/enhancer-binding protein alpha-like isoform X1 [Pyrgilauda ruficollis]
MPSEEGDAPEARMRGRACTGRQRLDVGTGRTEKLLGDPEQEEAELAALPPGSQSLCQLGQQQPVPHSRQPSSPPPAGAACSEPAATPGWQRGAAAWDPCSRSLCPGQGSPPAARGRAASEAPAGASGRRGCAGPGSAGLSSARPSSTAAPGAGDEPGAAEAKTPFAKPSPG